MLPFLLLLAQVTLVPGTAMTWTDGTYTWAGNPFCVFYGTNYTLLPTSPAIDAGALIEGFHCPLAGSALNQPRQPNGDFCWEWYGKAPDIGGCEFVPTQMVKPPNPPALTNVE